MGWLSWLSGFPAHIFLLSVLVLSWLWGVATSRTQAFLLFLGYYLVGGLGAHSHGLTGMPSPLAAIILAAPFGLLHGTGRPYARYAAALIITSSAWLSPLISAGAMFPGQGVWGLIGTLALLSAMTLAPSLALKRSRAIAVMATIVAMAAADTAWNVYRPLPDDWFAQQTTLTELGHGMQPPRERHQVLIGMAAESINSGAKVILFPSGIAGQWTQDTQAAWSGVGTLAKEQGATILIDVDAIDGAAPYSLVAIGADQRGYGDTPSKDGFAAVGGKAVAALPASKEMLAWPLALTFIAGSPAAILSTGSGPPENESTSRIRRRSIEMQAVLYGVPLFRATNNAGH